jgi:hypothetical protein
MALSSGTVTLTPDGTATTSGLAGAIYDQFVDNYLADTGQVMPSGAESYQIKKGYMIQANRLSEAIITHIVVNAEVAVTTDMPGAPVGPNCVSGGVIGGFFGNSEATGTGILS